MRLTIPDKYIDSKETCHLGTINLEPQQRYEDFDCFNPLTDGKN